MLGCLVPSSRNFINWKADVLSIRKESVNGCVHGLLLRAYNENETSFTWRIRNPATQSGPEVLSLFSTCGQRRLCLSKKCFTIILGQAW